MIEISGRCGLGRLIAMPGEIEALLRKKQSPSDLLMRHQSADWGEICEGDKEENNLSLKEGFCLLSACTLKDGTKIWLITEADRSATTILLPEEY
jgi:hypothetical protein